MLGTGAAIWRNMSQAQKAPFRRQAEIALAKHRAEKTWQDNQMIVYSLTSAGLAAATKLKKKASATAAAGRSKRTTTTRKTTAKKITIVRPTSDAIRVRGLQAVFRNEINSNKNRIGSYFSSFYFCRFEHSFKE